MRRSLHHPWAVRITFRLDATARVLLQVRLDKPRAAVDVDLAEWGGAGVDKSMWRARWDDCDITGGYFPFLIADGDPAASFQDNYCFNIGMYVQNRTASRRRVHKID